MKIKLTLLFWILPLIASEPVGFRYWSAQELEGFSKTLAPKAAHNFANDRLGDFGNHYALIAYRGGSGEAELHETEADLFVVQSGSATLVLGGKMLNAKTTAPNELRGPSIDGGSRQKLSAGDVVHIPPKTPHQLLLEPGSHFTYFVLKVKE